jgi:hypothetical protein
VRELKTRDEISAWITRELNTRPGCEEATVTVRFELLEPEPDGCNWADDLILNYGRNDSYLVLQHLRPLYQEARRRFNVSEP